MTWTIDGCISMQNLDIVRGSNRIAMLDCENEALCDGDILANARLIAAAPDMLAALEALLADALELGLADSSLSGSAIEARTAINKAKGN
jgi:hypothetical protein